MNKLQSFLTSWAQELKKVDDYLSAAYLVVYDQVIHTGSGRNELVLRCRIGKRRQELNNLITLTTGCQIEGGRTKITLGVRVASSIYKELNHLQVTILGCLMEGGITILYINVKNIMYIYKLQNMKKKVILHI